MLRKSLLVPFTFLFLSNCVDVDDSVIDDEPALGEAEEELIGPGGGGGEPGCTIPDTPTLAVQSSTASSLTLLAQSDCGNAGSAIERRLGTSGTFTRLTTPPLWGSPYTNTGLAAQTQYCYRVISNIGTNTRTSNIACGTTKMTPPAAPAYVTIENITGSTFSLSFEDNSTNEDGFKIYHRTSTGYDAPTVVATTSKTGTGQRHRFTITPTGDGNGYGTHCYVVNAYHADGQTYGAEVCAKLQSIDDPDLDAVEWAFEQPSLGSGAALAPRTAGTLQNIRSGANLVYQSRSFGVSLGWGSGPGNLEIERAPASSFAPIVDSEKVAIRVPGGGYLHYYVRSWGINLGFSSTPKYEWRLRRPWHGSYGDREGYPMRGSLFAITNTVYGDYLVYGERSNGVHLKWFRDTIETQTPPPGMTFITDSIWLTAGNQNGWVVWQGGIGGTYDDGELQKISLPSTTNLEGFFFLKGSAGGDKCVTADSSNGVFVRKGEAMKEGQKLALWGTATPSIPLTLRGCACFTNNCPYVGTSPPQAVVNVEWISN